MTPARRWSFDRDGVLEFEVSLDGACVDLGALDAIAGRVDVLGGTLEITSARVAGRLPVRHQPPSAR